MVNQYSKEYLRSLPHDQFLESHYWWNVRQLAIARDGNQCQVCGQDYSLEVHHLTYEHKGEEHRYLEDLQTLCSTCHSITHNPDQVREPYERSCKLSTLGEVATCVLRQIEYAAYQRSLRAGMEDAA